MWKMKIQITFVTWCENKKYLSEDKMSRMPELHFILMGVFVDCVIELNYSYIV